MYKVYQTTNLVNQKTYIGVHKCSGRCQKNGECQYYGSGTSILRALKKYGRDNFKREILKVFDDKTTALKYEAKVVNEQFVNRPDTYNMTVGGSMPPRHYSHTEEAKEKIRASFDETRRRKLSETAKKNMANRMASGGWTKEEVAKRIETMRKNGSFSDMKSCHTEEAIRKRVVTRKLKGNYSQKNDHLKDKSVVFERTKTRIQRQLKEGKSFSEKTLLKYGLI